MTERYWEANVDADLLNDLINENVVEAIAQLFTRDPSLDLLAFNVPMMWYPVDGHSKSAPPDEALTIRVYPEGTEPRHKDLYLDFDLADDLLDAAKDCAVDGSWRTGLERIGHRMVEVGNEILRLCSTAPVREKP